MNLEDKSTTNDRNGVGDSNRRDYLRLAGSALTAGTVGVAGCIGGSSTNESYPTESIKWINPSGGGGGYGAYAQALSKFVPEELPNDVEMPVTSVGNWPRGTSKIDRADPDGYTIGWVDVPGVVGYQLVQNPNFDLREFSLISCVAFHPFSIAVPQDSPYRSVEDLQKADEVTFAAPGGAVVTILSAIGADVMDIPLKLIAGYSGSPGIINAALRGDVEAVSLPPTTPPMANALENDELRLIVSYGDKPPEIAPDAPTAAELGHDELAGKGITRLVGGPPKIDDTKLDALSSSIVETIESKKEFKQWATENKLSKPLAPMGREGARQVLKENFDLMRKHEDVLAKHL